MSDLRKIKRRQPLKCELCGAESMYQENADQCDDCARKNGLID